MRRFSVSIEVVMEIDGTHKERAEENLVERLTLALRQYYGSHVWEIGRPTSLMIERRVAERRK